MNLIAYDGQIELEEDDWTDTDLPEEGEEDEWECVFGADCLMPNPVHKRSECYTMEMAEEWAREQSNAAPQ